MFMFDAMDLKTELQFEFEYFVAVVYLCGIVTGIFIRGCYNRCASRNSSKLTFDKDGLPVNCAIPLPFYRQEAFRGTGPEFTENVAEAKTEDGNTIFWAWERHMYHSASCCPILTATAKGRSTREQSSCRVCEAKLGPCITVTANGTRFHQRDCREIGHCKTLELALPSVQFAVESRPNLTEFDRCSSSSKGCVKI